MPRANASDGILYLRTASIIRIIRYVLNAKLNPAPKITHALSAQKAILLKMIPVFTKTNHLGTQLSAVPELSASATIIPAGSPGIAPSTKVFSTRFMNKDFQITCSILSYSSQLFLNRMDACG